MTAGARTRTETRADAGAALVEVCARQADELAGLLAAIEAGRKAEALGSGCWLGATLRVLAASLGELHAVLDEAAQLVDERPGRAERRPVPAPREAATSTPPAGMAVADVAGGPEVVLAAVEGLHAWRHQLGLEVMRAVAEVWSCASTARYGATDQESRVAVGGDEVSAREDRAEERDAAHDEVGKA